MKAMLVFKSPKSHDQTIKIKKINFHPTTTKSNLILSNCKYKSNAHDQTIKIKKIKFYPTTTKSNLILSNCMYS